MLAEQTVPRLETHEPAIGLPDRNPGREAYRVDCANCGAIFDALAVEWCHCVTSEPTLVCPSCKGCFCKAALPYTRRFWAGAPGALRRARRREDNPEAPAAADPEAGPRIRPLVLLVDDEAVIRHLATHVISRLGYDVIVATNGADGLEMARRWRPDIVLTDALMPKMDGREMCRTIKSDPQTAHIKVLLMTSLYTSVRYQNEGFKTYRADGYVSKPLDRVQLGLLLAENLPARERATLRAS